ncbi:MAG: putative selenate reductase subunit YgfK [Lachnospiraceae bacterium]|nr:putative selenate reductase subunit YgfK [Lachnospiraceae bacterium]
MSDIMRPMSFGHLMEWILDEHERYGSIFGVRHFVRYDGKDAMPIFDETIESPFGPAAGPNTQLAQNIIASYAAGSRFFELKTVQIMDGAELSKCISKPCITAADECYNCEWSTELTVPEACAEYIHAYVACKLLAKEFGFGDPDAFVFNMSVGYDLEGIKSEKINTYIDNMKDAGNTEAFKEATEWALLNLGRFKNVDEAFVKGISPNISNSITESTLHGCPPDEIERIATYLLTEKKLHTYIKCNPTLLGYDYARKRLDSLGFDYIAFDDHHFNEDLKWADAVPMLKRLAILAKENGLEFGVKLSNTFPVDVKAGELPSEEMYMAGRSLFPLTVHMARLISDEFEGRLRISYSGGAVLQNIDRLYQAGIWPVTMATNILKPGGYERFAQIGDALKKNAPSPFTGIDLNRLHKLDEDVINDPLYKKSIKPLPDRHLGKKLPLFSCFTSPCSEGCPINQDIPAYLRAMEERDPEKAFRIIIEKNALPFITGTICPHHCGDKCMRNYYEESLHIRETKLEAAKEAYEKVLPLLKASLTPGKEPVCSDAREGSDGKCTEKKAAIVGGGPAGLAAAYFLSRAGISVTIFEKRESLGGIVRHTIPGFRIDEASVDKDISLCLAYGAGVKTGTEITSVRELKEQGFTDVILCVGAWKPGDVHLKYGEALDAVDFLTEAKSGPGSVSLGTDVIVLGGGNTAMDTARAAKRIRGVKNVRLVYRRTRRYMPADEEELNAALQDGVEFMELLAPIGFKDGVLSCSVMELGEADASGRRAPVDTGRTVEIPADTVIAAVGESVDTGLYEEAGIKLDQKGRPVTDENMLTSVQGVYAAGDGRRGPATVVEAVSDAAKAAKAIAGISFDKYECENAADDTEPLLEKKGVICTDTSATPDRRCLGCPAVCAVCADVCPNRANIYINVPGKCSPQILHVDRMCNECGNCEVFCPYDGAPYRDKFTLFCNREDFDNSTNDGFMVLGNDSFLLRLDGKEENADMAAAEKISTEAAAIIKAVLNEYPYLL